MDKMGIIQEHSKIKLELYRLYLESYLSVLLTTRFFNRIEVIDVFAGSGISQNEEKGSAVIAAETIASVRKEHNKFGKQVALKLNDSDTNSCAALTGHLNAYDFASVTCVNADQYIQSWNPTSGSHNLFFIDPHGYTQVSTTNLSRLFATQHCDFLIFIPINHIYRFLKPSHTPNSQEDSGFLSELGFEGDVRQVDVNNYYGPIKQFLAGLGIEEAAAQTSSNVKAFADVIIAALRKISGSKYVYCQMIQNKENNNRYGLFFISHHVLGAEKFLDAQSKLKRQSQEALPQMTFDFVAQPETESILAIVTFDCPYDNVALYELAIENGIRPAELKKFLKDTDKSKIEINSLPGKKRNSGGLYIDYKHFSESDRIITVTFRS